jgi:hypothetical protein
VTFCWQQLSKNHFQGQVENIVRRRCVPPEIAYRRRMNNLKAIRDDYIRRFRARLRTDATHFACGSLAQCVARAARAETATGKHKHQWRVPLDVLTAFATNLALRLSEIERAATFDRLLAILDEAKPKGIGELTIYDTAVRIGYGLNLAPEAVYLHAGTRKGAKRLLPDVRRPFVLRAEFPSEWDGLSPVEIEDLLCSYARYLGTNAERFAPANCAASPVSHCLPRGNTTKPCL